jgi:hypothetical protein
MRSQARKLSLNQSDLESLAAFADEEGTVKTANELKPNGRRFVLTA